MPYYSGNTSHANYAVTGGFIHNVGRYVRLFYGAGYGSSQTVWQLADSEGGDYVLNKDLTHKGIAGEMGVMVVLGRLSVAASAITIEGKQWQAMVGVGINLSKK